MSFLGICENIEILRIIYFARKILNIAFIILPIALIIFLIIDLVKMMLTSNEKQNKNMKTIINRIIFSILIFFVPTIVNVVMTALGNAGIKGVSEYTVCLTNTNKETFDKLNKEALKEQNDKKPQLNNDGVNPDNNGNIPDNNDNTITPPNNPTTESNQDFAIKMLNIAIEELGYKEEIDSDSITKDDNKYGAYYNKNGYAWCALFVKWVAQQTEINGKNLFDDIINKEELIAFGSWDWAVEPIYVFDKSENMSFHYSKYYGGNYTPKKGDYIFFNWDKNWNKRIYKGMHNEGSHVGIVEYAKDGYVHVIEGNAGSNNDSVVRKQYQLTNEAIMGYGSWY